MTHDSFLSRLTSTARVRLGSVALALVASTSLASAQPSPRWASAIDSTVTREMAITKTPGVQIAIVDRGRLVYSKGYGVADVDSKRPVTEQTVFLTGSVAKLLTSTLLAQLAAQRITDLQVPISRYVPELAGRRLGAVTTHQLLTHSAGWTGGGTAIAPPINESALGEQLRALSDTMVMTEPGRVPSYSNTGFSMAGLVAERSAGRPFADLADSLVFRPLRMTRSTFRPKVAATHEYAQSHVGPATAVGQVQPTPFNAVDAPSGFLHTTAPDLSRLAIALMGGGILDGQRVLAAEAVRAATSGHFPIPGEMFLRYGYGMEIDSVGRHRTWQKSGHMPGYSALVTMWPNETFAVVVLANRRTTITDSVTVRAADIVRGIRPLPTATYGGLRDPTPPERAELVGTYKNGNVRVVVADTNGALHVRLLRLTLPAQVTGDGSRIIAAASAVTPAQSFVIVRDAGGSVRFLYRDNARAYAKQP